MSDVILIVDDEPDLLETVSYSLQREGFTTRCVASGQAALDAAVQDPPPNLILLDLMLPDISGTEVCKRLRAEVRTSAIPVVILSAKGEEIDRVVGFEIGADDYMVKPFSVRELVLRVRAVLRRCETQIAAPDERQVLGCLCVDPVSHTAFVDGEEVALTRMEFRLLCHFVARKGRVQTRDTLLLEVWGSVGDQHTRTVDTHIKRLRKKLGRAGKYIETLRGVGYRFLEHPGD